MTNAATHATSAYGNQTQDQTLEGLKTRKCGFGSAIQRSQRQHLSGQANLPASSFE